MKQSITALSFLFLVNGNLWGEEKTITFTLAPEPGVVQFELELWKQQNFDTEIPLRVFKKPGKVELKIPNGYEYFRAAGVAKRQIRGFWSELMSVSSFGKKRNTEKQTPQLTTLQKPEETLDILVPIQTKTGEVKQYLTAKKIRIVPEVNSEKKVSYFYRVNSGVWTESLDPEIEINNEGFFNLEFKSIDILGNKEIPKKLFFYVDKTPPTTSVQKENLYLKPSSGYFVSSSNSIIINAIDNDSGVKATYYQPICENSKGDWILLENNYIKLSDLKKFCSTSMKIKLYSVDQVGNREDPIIIQVNSQTQ